ncbi:polyhydroxyalkanoate synthase [Alcanivorax sp. S71-1-4]|uniref:alpha/beta fold hydrolase n=1 Tax=Alcanivorax sp. S71-1-4 TaxID=1177159 RepID=UPI00135B393B|nr:alpha/beta fold hydrolase [Alcanivorax sp. S71-1-4]KAF0808271.1 polyhydroxyalkanoate synthase [Alcanivorax sp. S71-1-4]
MALTSFPRSLARATGNARAWLRRDPSVIQAERTPFEVIHQQDIVRLRYYPPLPAGQIEVDGEMMDVATTAQPVPLVLVSPLAVNMLIYDLFPERSLVRYLRARGFELYLVDWGRPGRAQDHWTLGTYIGDLLPQMLAKVREHSGSQKLSLHGWSFGGLFSLCYTALSRDPDIVNLALIGAPCDYHANGVLGEQYQRLAAGMQWIQRRTGWRVHQSKPAFWRSPGWANSLLFKLTAPVASARSYAELLTHLGDRDFVSNHATNSAFLDDMVAYPGATVQDILQYLWTDNVLPTGRLPIRGCAARFSDVTANTLLVSGRQDPIVTRACIAPIQTLVSSDDVSLLDVPGGHMGILGGSQAAKTIWPAVADWLSARSGQQSDATQQGVA